VRVFSTAVKGRVSTSPRDIPYGENRIIPRRNKTRWRCREHYCEHGSFTESIEQVPARARTTGRLRTQIGAAIGDAPRSVSEVATVHGVSWPTAHRAFVAHAKAFLAEPEPTRVLGIDETRRGKPHWTRCKLTRRGSIRGTPGSSTSPAPRACAGNVKGAPGPPSSTGYVSARCSSAIGFVAIDPAAVYASAIRTPGLLPNAQIVVDHFHLVTWELRDHRIRFHCTGKQRTATQTSSLPGQNRRRQMRPVGVVLNVGRGSLDLNVAGRLADGSRAGRLIRCESRRCGGDRHGGNTRRQQWCDVLQFHFHDGTP